MRPALAGVAAVLLAVLAVVLISSGGDDTYTAKMRLSDASGLRNGSPVVVGGVPIGAVKLSANENGVVVKLKIQKSHAPLGKNATAAIIAQNVLGQKQVRLTYGNRSDPAPDGYTIPTKNITIASDLDQLLSTLDPDTRARLAVLLNESGTAFAGREMDFRQFVEDFVPALDSATDVVGELTKDNRALTELLGTSDRYIATVAQDRRSLARMLNLFGQTTATVAARRAALRQTLRNAPAALASAQTFLTQLRETAGPLASTSRRLTATAPALESTLERIEPFRAAAAPALKVASTSTPVAVERLGEDKTDMRRLYPTAHVAGALLTNEIPQIGATLDKSADNLLGALDNWAHAIQFSDGLGHIFRGEASFTPDFWESIVRRYTGGAVGGFPPSGKKARKSPARSAPQPLAKAMPKPVAKVKSFVDKITKPLADKLKAVTQAAKPVTDDVGKLLNAPSRLLGKDPSAPRDDDARQRDLLNYLLGP